MLTRNRIALALTAVSLVLLWPGLTQPVLTIKASMEFFGTRQELASETRSVIGAIRSLHDSGNDFVAGLILLFSVLIPLAKTALLAPIFMSGNAQQRSRLHALVRAVSKWSMADVFAVGMLIALLAAKGTANLTAVAGPGLYYFAAYCLVSNLAFQALEVPRASATSSTSSSRS